MQNKEIEVLELKYHSSVNNQIDKLNSYTVFENTFVPEMYDHNFIYIHRPVSQMQFEKIYEQYKHQNLQQGKMYVNFYFKVNLQVEETVYENVLKNEDYEAETVVFLELAQDSDQWKKYEGIEVVKVNTNQLLEEFLHLNVVEDSTISKGFAKDKSRFNEHLYQKGLCDFYLAYYQGMPAASGELYAFNRVGKFENLFVAESFRNKGIATELMKEMITHSKKAGLTDFYLATYQYDDPIKLYNKLGFIEIGKQKNITTFFN